VTYRKRLILLAIIDSLIVLSGIYVSYLTIYTTLDVFNRPSLLVTSISLFISHHVFASVCKLYKKAWEYSSIGELVVIMKVVSSSLVVSALVQFAFTNNVAVRALLITWMLHVLFIGGSRFSWRVIQDSYFKTRTNSKRTLIIGAGAAGTMVARQLLNNHQSGLKPVAFIDDDPNKQDLHILGLPVAGNTPCITEAVRSYDVSHIIIAIPSLKKKELNKIFTECSRTSAKTQILPKIEDIVLGKISVNQFRDVQVEDLLGRDPVDLNIDSISEYVTGKTILVTGAGGSIGSEICRQVCKFSPAKVVLLGHGENSIYQIEMELRNKYKGKMEIIPNIGDIQDRQRIFEVLAEQSPQVVYHAAAHKHVPLMEYNPREAVKNNILGTKNIAEASDAAGVDTFVLISSDKAVNPTNIMGSTKRIAEMIIQQVDRNSKTKFVAVRFGNVLGSRGSVIPLFKKQIREGGPVTVTHPEMTRYFMTIPEASRLVIQAGALAKGGEIFVLDMGEPVKITDLAKNLIKLSGYSIEEIGIEYTGIRPGEKMYEELLNENEVNDIPVFPKIFIGKSQLQHFDQVQKLLNQFEHYSVPELRNMLLDIANNRDRGVNLLVK
jgi:FlaA1/EpsC-like NDP-sugar epimerase